MSNIKNYFISFLIFFLLLLLSIFFINIFYYYNLLNENIYRFLKLLFIIIDIFIGGFILGKNSNSKGYLNGFIFGLFIISIMFLLSLFFSKIQIKLFVYYLLILSSSSLGGTIGIRKKKKY